MKIKDLAAQLFQYVQESGWVSDPDLQEYGLSLDNVDVVLVHKAIRKLDREGVITQKSGPDAIVGWEIVGAKGVSAKRYSGYSEPLMITMCLRTAALGQVSEDDHNFIFERDIDKNIVLTSAQFKAMLTKAHAQTVFIPSDDGDLPSRESVRRWLVLFSGIELPVLYDDGKPLPIRTRRPLNEQGKPVGEMRHESLPPGAKIKWLISWPESHYDTVNAWLLLKTAAEIIGFSPAGNGRYGGLHGIFAWDGLPPTMVPEILQQLAVSDDAIAQPDLS